MPVAHAFSPKEWKVGVVTDATNAGATGIGSTMYQLDVDSIGFPSLNVNQKLDVRSGASRTFKDEDFFQDNVMRAVEISLSGTLHNDAGHKLLAQNICNDVTTDIAVATGFTASSQKYGSAVTNSASSLTLVMQPSDVTNQQGLEFFGCVVTAFSITAEGSADGGQYKWSATLQTGKKPDLASTAEPTITAYANTTIPLLSSSSGHKVFNVNVILSSFTTSIESPAVFTGVASDGYQVVSRGAEISVTADAQVKYDGNTKGFINSFDTQSSALSGNMLVITNNNAFGVAMPNGVLTNVALAEGDLMMLDCSIKAVDDGSTALVTFDVSA
jgi:hypothetical protein|tara:strand:- start:1613 stop:2599 length:987 start_codon:yes stop_codon:yes gene_type:complete